MNKFFYETPIDSPTGERISKFWQQCIRCEQAAEDYAKRMGAKYYYSDPRYFAGGVVCIAFAEDQRIDTQVWRKAGVDRNDGLTYYEPDVQQRTGLAEIPHRDYALKDTFDRIYQRDKIIEREVPQCPAVLPQGTTKEHPELLPQGAKKLFIPYVEFFRPEPPARSNSGHRQASRGLRKAIKAEALRLRLPVMRTGQLLAILTATPVPSMDVSRPTATPTFFPFRSRYFIGTASDCSTNSDLMPITSQQYTMNEQLARLADERGLE